MPIREEYLLERFFDRDKMVRLLRFYVRLLMSDYRTSEIKIVDGVVVGGKCGGGGGLIWKAPVAFSFGRASFCLLLSYHGG